MSRYIDADKVLTAIEEAFHNTDPEGQEQIGVLTCHRIVRTATTADVVEVVRCKDCMYWTGKDYDGCCIKNGLATRYAKDYCSYGERREDGN